MRDGINKLYLGDFNIMNQEVQTDDSVIITLFKNGENNRYKFRVKNLYGENEEVLEEEVIELEILSHVKNRMEEAKKWK